MTARTEALSAEARLFGELEMLGRLAWMVTQLEVMVRAQIDALHEADER